MTVRQKKKNRKKNRVEDLPLTENLRFFERAILWSANHFSAVKKFLIKDLEKISAGLKKESRETREMVEAYRKFLLREEGGGDLKEANRQFQDVLRGLGLGVFLVLPFSVLTLPLLIRLGKKLGVEVLPDSFRGEESEIVKGVKEGVLEQEEGAKNNDTVEFKNTKETDPSKKPLKE